MDKKRIQELLCGKTYSENISLSQYSSMKTGGVCPICVFPETQEEFTEILCSFEENKVNFRVFGNCSNVLFPDENIDFVSVFTHKLNKTEIISESSCEIYAECGTNLTSVSNFAMQNGLSGLEFAYGIPASVGGAVLMNAGAYGGEMKDVVKSVKVYSLKDKRVYEKECPCCHFEYRKSAFSKDRDHIILGATLKLSFGEKEKIKELSLENMQKRRTKQPLEYPSCGSAFKRPEGYFAGKLIEDSGLKGASVGGACVSPKHAGFIINTGGATTKDVLDLMEKVKNTVYEKFSVLLEGEIEII